jgi:general secretion pathway protein A
MIPRRRMYERYFNLKDQPFRLTPDPAYLFLGTKHREGFAHLLFAMREGSGFVAVTGEVGTGKTTLVRALLGETRNDNIAVSYIFNPVLSPTELLQTINAEFGLPARATSKKQLTDTLNRFLLAQKADGGRAVVIVDEAQNLDREVLEQLRLLSNLETETEKLMQIILLGQPELRDVLDRPDLRQLSQRVAIRWHLDPLDRQETHRYVRHRLRVAGGDEALFEPKAIDVLYDHSAGIPRLINIIAHRALLVAFTNGRRSVGPDEVAAAAVELGQSRIPIKALPRSWVYKAAAGAAGVTAAAVVALVLVLPMRDDTPGAPSAAVGLPPAAKARSTEKSEKLDKRASAAAVPAPAQKKETAAEVNPAEVSRIEKRLAATDAFASTAASVARLVELWTGTPPDKNELDADTLDMEAVGARRSLSYLGARLSPALLASVDLPAIVELRVGADGETRYVVIERAGASMVTLHLEKPLSVSRPTFERMWTGVAHLYWKDAEAFRQSFKEGESGPAVTRMQGLLTELGVLRAPASGVYDADTGNAVRTLQTSYGLPADGKAGELTQIILYNAVARFPRPALSSERSKAREKTVS